VLVLYLCREKQIFRKIKSKKTIFQHQATIPSEKCACEKFTEEYMKNHWNKKE
jgi:hypothetical protein